MPTYTITTNTSVNEDLGVQYGLGIENANRAALDPPLAPLTAQQYLKQRLNDIITSHKNAYKQKMRDDAANGVLFE